MELRSVDSDLYMACTTHGLYSIRAKRQFYTDLASKVREPCSDRS